MVLKKIGKALLLIAFFAGSAAAFPERSGKIPGDTHWEYSGLQYLQSNIVVTLHNNSDSDAVFEGRMRFLSYTGNNFLADTYPIWAEIPARQKKQLTLGLRNGNIFNVRDSFELEWGELEITYKEPPQKTPSSTVPPAAAPLVRGELTAHKIRELLYRYDLPQSRGRLKNDLGDSDGHSSDALTWPLGNNRGYLRLKHMETSGLFGNPILVELFPDEELRDRRFQSMTRVFAHIFRPIREQPYEDRTAWRLDNGSRLFEVTKILWEGQPALIYSLTRS